MLEQLLAELAAMQWLEATGLASGLVCVWLLIRQNIWTWPIGLLYALVSVAVFYRARLYADLGLHVFYVAMNAYGWYYWLRGNRPVEDEELPVTHIEPTTATVLGLIVMLATLVMAQVLASETDADLPYWDSATTTMSLAAMWMQARKQLECWYVWLAVDVLATGIYVYKGLELYALLYCVYIGMAFAGWWAWRRSMPLRQPA
jgi:nicotinamide mononucleotide transporter